MKTAPETGKGTGMSRGKTGAPAHEAVMVVRSRCSGKRENVTLLSHKAQDSADLSVLTTVASSRSYYFFF